MSTTSCAPPTRPRRARRSFGGPALSILLLAASFLMLGPAPASAHAGILSIDPVADWVYESGPTDVALTFSEPVTADLGGIRVFGPDGERVDGATELRDNGAIVVAPIDATQRGTYTVAWSVVSSDSHVLASSFVFHVGEKTGAAVAVATADAQVTAWLSWAARWALFAGAIVLGGLALYRLAAGFPLADGRARTVAISAAVLLLAGALLKSAVQATAAAGMPLGEVFSLGFGSVLATRAGMLDGVRIGAALVALVGAMLWRSRIAACAAGSAVLVVTITLALLGHAWGVQPTAGAVAVDVVHQLAVITWVGGLVALVTMSDRSQVGTAIRRFSRIALYALIAVVVSGLASALWQTAADPSTLTTAYGILLLTKIALVAVMAGLGWWQRRRLAKAVASAGTLLTGVRAEAAVAGIVLAVTAVLVGTVPAREALGPQPYAAQVEEDLGTVAVTVEPALTGENVVTLSFADRVGSPRAVDVAQLSVRHGDLPPRDVTLTALGPDRWAAIGVALPATGEWVFELTSLSRGQQSAATFTVRIDGPGEGG